MSGKLITLEGLDGAGKSTHLVWIRDFLQASGVRLCVTREPGGTALGETLRRLLLDGEQALHPETEALLMFAARREHIDKVIAPALGQGDWVLCDRFTDASFAYQSGGSGVDWDKIGLLESWVQGGLQPDLTVYLDVTPEVGRARTGAIKAPDRYEQERTAFHVGTRAAYLRRARDYPRRIRVVDATGTVSEVQAQLEQVLSSFCGQGA